MTAPPRTRLRTLLASLGGIAVAGAAAWFGLDPGDSPATPVGTTTAADAPDSTGNTCPVASLPREAGKVIAAIEDGGPFAHPDNDGVRFGNYEGHLPPQDRDYYREYTVDTPGLSHRGPRRIVTGGPQATDPEVWYYTSDHYESFCEIPDAE
ncbi:MULTISPECIES: ribonuclease domain-containing protein [unclassified Corynebacterium]|uniref:ribonuclease domain-containing protein n=1 Tax=unclassified Corynebacterium TaxID=2624378 RepID=UPI001D0DE4B7|nr:MULTISPECIES: ribonuclease domain-containing protein [unclassified Corynebacterium]